ncbi:MAG: hypothetical protein HN926_10385 [Chloroflexi bacterium]|nr:hypothetical protein [Chloroflexota bacterium]MBT4340502.1 hypothetical protein [Chloroflexota bacterium]MBT7079751.1 hypothetical protein [Chloroflexota bacterium]MBT7468240.1 hypothetical protein [Chloroflexota bacterium]
MNTNNFPTRPLLTYFSVMFVIAISFSALSVTARAQDQDEEPIVGYRILGESQAGAHLIQLQVSPVTPIVGTSRFAVRIRDAATREDIDDAKVTLLAAPAEHGEAQYTLVLNSPVDPIFYLSQLDLETEGLWAVEVGVETELGTGTTVMSVKVESRGRNSTGNGWGTALFVLISLSFVVGTGWIWYTSKKALKRRDQLR